MLSCHATVCPPVQPRILHLTYQKEVTWSECATCQKPMYAYRPNGRTSLLHVATNHRPLDCLINSLIRITSEKIKVPRTIHLWRGWGVHRGIVYIRLLEIIMLNHGKTHQMNRLEFRQLQITNTLSSNTFIHRNYADKRLSLSQVEYQEIQLLKIDKLIKSRNVSGAPLLCMVLMPLSDTQRKAGTMAMFNIYHI